MEYVVVATLLLTALAVIAGLAPYVLGRLVAAPKVGQCYLHAQGGYDVPFVFARITDKADRTAAYGFPTLSNPIFRPVDVEGLLTQAPVLAFDVSNVSQYEMRLRAVLVEVTRFEVGEICVGQGEMIGGSIRHFECKIEPQVGLYEAELAERDADYVTVAPGATEPISIRVRCDGEGYYEIRPVVEWQVLLKRGRVAVACDSRGIVFFSKAPPAYSRPRVPSDLK